MKNNIAKFSKSILFIFLGIFLGLLILELCLRGLGYYQKNWTKFSNTNIKQSDELRILALGESMTNSGVNPYPEQLQEILSNNSKINKKVKVINGGVSGSSSKDIVKNLEAYLDQYEPDIVVVMTGINGDQKVDYDQWANIKKEDWLNNIKTIKLIKYLYQNYKNKLSGTINKFSVPYVYADELNVDYIINYILNNKISSFDGTENNLLLEKDTPQTPYEINLLNKLKDSNSKDIVCIELSNYYAGRSLTKKAIEYALKAISFNLNNSDAYQRLSNIQTLPREYREKLAEKSIETNPTNAYAYISLAEIYKSYGDSEKYIETYKKGLQVIPNSFHLLYEVGKYSFAQEDYNEAENYLLKALKVAGDGISNGTDIYQLLAKIYQKQNRNDEANKVLGLAISTNDVLENNYPIIANILKKRGIKLIAMQYPLRDVNILKSILKGYDVSYVDNYESFRVAIEKNGIKNIFIDLFAGDFGHCTAEGNRIIANNVASIILSSYEINN